VIPGLVEKHFNDWINGNLTSSIKILNAKITESELRSFILNHENLPLLKRNLVKQLSVPEFCLDYEKIKLVTQEMAKFFMAAAIKYHDMKRNSYGTDGKKTN
jgi:hypothetical protein